MTEVVSFHNEKKNIFVSNSILEIDEYVVFLEKMP